MRTLASLLGELPYLPDPVMESRAERTLATFFASTPRLAPEISTDRLICLVESLADDLDVYADLGCYGDDVEGVTLYGVGHRPRVKVAGRLAEARNPNRFRTTLAHELGHVLAHGPVFDARMAQKPLPLGEEAVHACRSEGIENPHQTFRIEWQAWALGMALLMPGSAVKLIVNYFMEEAGVYSAGHYDSDLGRSMTSCVAETFRVSEQAARNRLIRLQCLVRCNSGPSLF